MSDIVRVAVAVIVNQDNEVCISLRHQHSHQGGLWEFPGGKIASGESIEQALTREIKEELNLEIETSRPLITITHHYHDKNVCLHVNRVTAYHGQATGVEGQQLRWVAVDQLSQYKFPAANFAIIKAVQLPEKYLITGKFIDEENFLQKLAGALDEGIKLVQLRLKTGDMDVKKMPALVQQASLLCTRSRAKLLFNIPQDYLQSLALQNIHFDGFHADSRMLKILQQRPAGKFFSASCHNEDELLKARQLGADFAVLSPVQKTASHPDMSAMGWPIFSSLVKKCDMPVYALGGVSENDLQDAWSHGAQGVAAISAFWR